MLRLVGGEAVFNTGKSAFTRLKRVLTHRGNDSEKANRALANVEAEPDDISYQQKLTTELEKLAQSDTELRTLLETLSTEVQQANGSMIEGHVYVSDTAKVDQAAGVNQGTMNYNARQESEQ